MRPAVADDVPGLLELAGELREALLAAPDAGLRPGTPAARVVLEERLREAVDCPDRRLVVVVDETAVLLGMALLTLGPANALFDAPALHVTHAVVGDRHRRRGAGRALVAAAAAYAEERGVDQLVVSVRAGSRESNRFFARLGFAPLAVRRTAPVGAVRRRLALDDRAAGPPARRRVRRPSVPLQAGPVPSGAPAEPET